MPTPSIRTPDQVRADFEARGLTIAEWSRSHQIKSQTVRDLLLGRIKGRYGEAHRAAVLLGLKAGRIDEAAPNAKATTNTHSGQRRSKKQVAGVQA